VNLDRPEKALEMPIPIFVVLGSKWYPPMSAVNAVVSTLGLQGVHPYTTCYLAILLLAVPHGLLIAYLANKKYNNKDPIRSTNFLMKSDTLLTKLVNSHNNNLENIGVFMAGVVAATEAGAPEAAALATFWLLLRCVYTLIYISPLNEMADGMIRTIVFTFMYAIQANLFLCAAVAAQVIKGKGK